MTITYSRTFFSLPLKPFALVARWQTSTVWADTRQYTLSSSGFQDLKCAAVWWYILFTNKVLYVYLRKKKGGVSKEQEPRHTDLEHQAVFVYSCLLYSAAKRSPCRTL